MCCCPLPSSSASSPVNTFAGRAHRGLRVIELPAFPRRDCITARQRKRAKWCRLACGTPLLTCPRTQRAPPNCAALRLQLWISLQRQNSPLEGNGFELPVPRHCRGFFFRPLTARQRSGPESLQTRCWREEDSNHRSLSQTSRLSDGTRDAARAKRRVSAASAIFRRGTERSNPASSASEADASHRT